MSRRRRRRPERVQTEPGVQGDPKVILSNTALKMLETFHPNAGRLALDRIEALKNPRQHRGTIAQYTDICVVGQIANSVSRRNGR